MTVNILKSGRYEACIWNGTWYLFESYIPVARSWDKWADGVHALWEAK